jgi:CMP-N,N'-diacetyllegionaminic acid synthase
MPNYVVFIPARGGSKRIPSKNIYNVGNKPLIYYSISMGVSLGYPTYVSTDSEEIAGISRSFGASIIQRPAEYATDKSLDNDWIIHALESIGSTGTENIVLLRPTTPFRDLNFIVDGIELFSNELTSMRSVEPMSEAVEKMMWIDNGLLVSVVINNKDAHTLPNQSFKVSYKPNGYLDILRSDIVLGKKELYGDKVQPLVTPCVPEIDALEDIEFAEFYGRKYGYIKDAS